MKNKLTTKERKKERKCVVVEFLARIYGKRVLDGGGFEMKRRRVFWSVGGLLCGDLFFACCDVAGQRF